MPDIMTAEQLFWMAPDHHRHELIRGKLTTEPFGTSEFGVIVINVSVPLWLHSKHENLGIAFGAGVGFLIEKNPDTVLAPDVAFVSQARIDAIGGLPPKFWPGAPDLAVEVVSPGDTVYEVEEKAQAWLTAGCQLVWVVNPKRRSVTIYRSGRNPTILLVDDTLDGEDVVPGFRISIREIFV